MTGTEARDLATFIVEPVGTNINSPTTFIARKKFQDVETTTSYRKSRVSTMFNDIMDQMSRPTASGSNMKGGLLYLKNGTYLLDSAGIPISDTTDDDNVSVRLLGESRDTTILKPDTDLVNDDILEPFCTFDLENITINGNCVATVNALHPKDTSTGSKILTVKNCRFTNNEGYDILVGHNQLGIDVSNCIFENHQMSEDNFAFECTGWARIHDNYFDRTTGTLTGATLTSGSVFNCEIYNNCIVRTAGNILNGISIEAYDVNPNNANVYIHDNLLINATIAIGSFTGYNTTFRNIVIDSNVLYGAGIMIFGPTSGSYSTQMKEFNIENNKIYNPYSRGILVWNTAGIGFVRNNTIYNSNIGLDATTFDKGGINLQNTTDMVCENNSIYMGVTNPENALFSPYGINYQDSVNLTLRNNTIINRTLANPAYATSGTHTGIKLISNSLH